MLLKLSISAPYGLFVCMSHSILTIKNISELNWNLEGVTVLGVPGDVDLSKRYGVLKKDEKSKYRIVYLSSEVSNYYLHLTPNEIRQKDVYFNKELYL